MTLHEAIAELIDSPEFPSVLGQLNERLRDEQAARARYIATVTEDDRDEFIGGKVLRRMPARKEHGDLVRAQGELVHTFIRFGVGGDVQTENAIIRGERNDYVPDFSYWPASVAANFHRKQVIFPTPAWIAEVLSDDTAERDRGVKFVDYAKLGVAEYWLIDPDAEAVEQYRNVGRAFALVKKHVDGVIQGIAIESFSLPTRALFDNEANAQFLRELWRTKA
jgi:Uma2 family endonuclease